MWRCALVSALLLAACGSPARRVEAGSGDPSDSTAGGEDERERERSAAPPLRTTTPVPVPQPAVAREELGEGLQVVWTSIEETVAIRPPEPPAETSVDAANAWARGPFAGWIGRRASATRDAIAASEAVPETPPFERALAAALIAYALEDFVADVRGAPVPESIATDPELLRIYVGELSDTVRPLAIEAVTYYAYCQGRLAALGDASEWLPWRAYCVQRGQEMIEVYGLTPPAE